MSISTPTPLLCPFCGARVPRPGEMDVESYQSSDGARCICGAVYAVDYTSHNLGVALLDAYCYAAGDQEKALDVDPDNDLDEAVVENYIAKSHQVAPKKSPNYAGASLYFVRLRPGAAERLAAE